MHPPIFLLLLIFPLLHWYTRFFDSISLSPSFFPVSSAFHLNPSLFPSIYFVFKLSRFHSQPISLAFFPHYVTWCFPVVSLAPISNVFLHFLYLFLFPPSPDLCSVHQYTLYHSPPEITSLISQTHPTTLFAFFTISLICALSVALSLNV
jgi:hypothetical protein